MNVHLSLDEDLVRSRDEKTLRQDLRMGLLLLDYLNGDISIGRFAESMDMEYVEARDWLHRQGISTMRRFKDPLLQRASGDNARRLAKRLGIGASDG